MWNLIWRFVKPVALLWPRRSCRVCPCQRSVRFYHFIPKWTQSDRLVERRASGRNNKTASVWAGRQRLVRLSGERFGLEAQKKIVFVNLIVCCWLSVFLPVRWQAAMRPVRAKIPQLSVALNSHGFVLSWISGVWSESVSFCLTRRASVAVNDCASVPSSAHVLCKHWRCCVKISCFCVDLLYNWWSTDMDVLMADAESTLTDKNLIYEM